jgi:hypothetical protein
MIFPLAATPEEHRKLQAQFHRDRERESLLDEPTPKAAAALNVSRVKHSQGSLIDDPAAEPGISTKKSI